MSSRAIVLIPATATLADLLQPIAGVPALLRLLLCAQRAGLGEILLLGVNRYPRSMQVALTRDARLTSRLVCVDDQPWSALVQACPDLEKAWWKGDLWVLPAGGVIDATLLRNAVQQADPDQLPSSIPNPGHLHVCTPFFRVSGAWLQPIVQASGDVALSALLLRCPQRSDSERLSNQGLVCAPAVSETNRAAVERGLFNGLESASDGWVDRYLNRKLSPWFSRWFVRMPLTPNHVTLIAWAIGLLAAFKLCAWKLGQWRAGGVATAMVLRHRLLRRRGRTPQVFGVHEWVLSRHHL